MTFEAGGEEVGERSNGPSTTLQSCEVPTSGATAWGCRHVRCHDVPRGKDGSVRGQERGLATPTSHRGQSPIKWAFHVAALRAAGFDGRPGQNGDLHLLLVV